jgi:hypothetical protein
MRKCLIIKALGVVILAIWPIVVDHSLMAKYNYYKALLDRYECYPSSDKILWDRQRKQCAGDFNGDGKTDSVVLKLDPKNPFVGKVSIVDLGSEPFYLDYIYQIEPDLTVYLAVNNDSGKAHLIIHDEVTRPDPLIGVFAWDGKQISQVQPSKQDSDILTALDAEGGNTAGNWNQYRFLRKPALFLYYALFFLAAYGWQLHSRKALIARLRPSTP